MDRADPERLERHVRALEGERHPVTAPDHSRFWDEGYPALMLTHTSFLRNPHYHRPTDRAATLDCGFMARVVDAAAATVRRLAGGADAHSGADR